jgi:hypothetical protein
MRLLYHEIDFIDMKCIDESIRHSLRRFLSSVHVTINRHLLAERVGFFDRVTLEYPSGSGRFRCIRIVPTLMSGLERDSLPVVTALALELLGRSRGEKIPWGKMPSQISIMAVNKTRRPKSLASATTSFDSNPKSINDDVLH